MVIQIENMTIQLGAGTYAVTWRGEAGSTLIPGGEQTTILSAKDLSFGAFQIHVKSRLGFIPVLAVKQSAEDAQLEWNRLIQQFGPELPTDEESQSND